MPAVVEEDSGNNNNGTLDEDELIIKDDVDQDCFEEVDQIGEIEKEVRLNLRLCNSFSQQKLTFQGRSSRTESEVGRNKS